MADIFPPDATFVFFHPDNDDYRRLRGGELFMELRGHGFRVVTSSDPDPRVNANARMFVFAAVDANPDVIGLFAATARRRDCCVLVDVTGPIWSPTGLLGANSQRFWSHVDNRRLARRMMRVADGLTTPSPDYVDGLLNHNPNVFVLPDIEEDDESAERFLQTLVLAWRTGLERKTTP